jgi:hypothetical protein
MRLHLGSRRLTGLVIASAIVVMSACAPVPPPVPPQPDASATVVTGQVIVYDTGQPFEGATVLFRNALGNELHTSTGADGSYSITLPPDTYNPWALVDEMVPFRFVLADPADAPVTVPPSQQVDFLVVPSG